MPNAPYRFRATPEVHDAAKTLQARGVDVGGLLSETLVTAAKEESPLIQWAMAKGLRVRKAELIDQDGVVVHVTTNGHGGTPAGACWVVCSFVHWRSAYGWTASATKIISGCERLKLGGIGMPDNLPVEQWIAFAEATL